MSFEQSRHPCPVGSAPGFLGTGAHEAPSASPGTPGGTATGRQAGTAGFVPADGGRPSGGRQDAEPPREHGSPGTPGGGGYRCPFGAAERDESQSRSPFCPSGHAALSSEQERGMGSPHVGRRRLDPCGSRYRGPAQGSRHRAGKRIARTSRGARRAILGTLFMRAECRTLPAQCDAERDGRAQAWRAARGNAAACTKRRAVSPRENTLCLPLFRDFGRRAGLSRSVGE